MSKLRITEIFHSLQGESLAAGLPTVFVRLTGCPLRCQYCDTEYAFGGGQWHSYDELLAVIKEFGCEQICVTGGEPLAQKRCYEFLTLLCDEGYKVSIETGGANDIGPVDPRVMVVMDLKTPDSEESGRNLWSNLEHIKPGDQIKFVICSRRDYDWVKMAIDEHRLRDKCELLLSPSYHQLKPAELADWILRDKLKVRMQMQLHKTIWGEEQGR